MVVKKKNKGGRPPKYSDEEELQKKIDAFFDKCDEDKEPYTMSGLANALGVDRKTLLTYSKKEKFLPTIKKARNRVEEYAEKRLFSGNAVAGVIFNLKNNFSWKDKIEVKQDTTLTLDADCDPLTRKFIEDAAKNTKKS